MDPSEPSCSLSSSNNLRPMFAIETPAYVKNLTNFYKCCGGLGRIEQTFQNDHNGIHFRFRPDNPNSIPLISERKRTTDLVLKVRRKRQPDGSFGDYQFEPYGIIDTIFHFENLICDMQLLPTSCDVRNELMKSDFILNCPNDYSLQNEESNTMVKQYFYTRFNQPKQIFPMMQKEKDFDIDLIRRVRKTRRMNAIVIRWDVPSIPQSMPEEYKVDNLLDSDLLNQVKKKFQERPIWSRHALLCQLKCSPRSLRFVLPLLAYYFENGPFRCLWISYGYDPRKDPKSKIYQTIEIRSHLWINLAEDSAQGKKFLIMKNKNINSDQSTDKSDDQATIDEKSYLFNPSSLSSLWRTNFQLCDIELEDVQKIAHENDGQEKEFTEKDGWLTKGGVERIRLLMNQSVTRMLESFDILTKRLPWENQEIRYEEIECSEVFCDGQTILLDDDSTITN